MADPRPHVPVLLVVAAFSRHTTARAWARERLEQSYGPVVLASPTYDFRQTSYYEPSMGTELQKGFFVFRDLVSPDCLPRVKQHTNALEVEAARSGNYPEVRPLNLDPGLLSLGKFMLASTKDQAHRIYLREGIYAEVTLRFQAGRYEPWPWTYADYRLPEVRSFLGEARAYYREQLRHHETG